MQTNISLEIGLLPKDENSKFPYIKEKITLLIGLLLNNKVHPSIKNILISIFCTNFIQNISHEIHMIDLKRKHL